jgi:hypothetical protein
MPTRISKKFSIVFLIEIVSRKHNNERKEQHVTQACS